MFKRLIFVLLCFLSTHSYALLETEVSVYNYVNSLVDTAGLRPEWCSTDIDLYRKVFIDTRAIYYKEPTNLDKFDRVIRQVLTIRYVPEFSVFYYPESGVLYFESAGCRKTKELLNDRSN